MEVVVADHVQKVLKTNFAASWEEIGESHELKDTYALSQMKSLEGEWTTRKSSRTGSFTIQFSSTSGEASPTFGHANANFSVFINRIRNQFPKK